METCSRAISQLHLSFASEGSIRDRGLPVLAVPDCFGPGSLCDARATEETYTAFSIISRWKYVSLPV